MDALDLLVIISTLMFFPVFSLTTFLDLTPNLQWSTSLLLIIRLISIFVIIMNQLFTKYDHLILAILQLHSTSFMIIDISNTI